MADLTEDQFNQLPDFAKDSFQLSGDVYVTVKDAKLKETLNDLDGKYKGAEATIRELGESQAEAIENAKREALEAAKSSGDVKDVERRFTEMMSDLETRKNSEIETIRGEYEALEGTTKSSKRQAVLADLRSNLAVFEDSAKAFDKLVAPMIDVDVKTGKTTYLSDDGSATSLDSAGFLDTLRQDSAFSRMRQATPTGSGGIAKGNSNTGGGATEKSQAAEVAKSKGDLNGFLQASL